MNTTQVLPAESSGVASRAPVAGANKVDISRGERIGRVSSEWFSRPDDERYLSLSTLYEVVRTRAERTTARTFETRHIRLKPAATTPNASP
jgi:hypothetical protein